MNRQSNSFCSQRASGNPWLRVNVR